MKTFTTARHNATRRRDLGHNRRRAARGFTLIEILIALAIFSLLLVIIFVPLNMGFNAFNIGNSRTQVQQASNTTVSQMERELRTAIYVYPNDAVPSVSNNAPYNRNPAFNNLPYFRQKAAGAGVCDVQSGGVVPTSNTSRLDFIVPRLNGNSVETPLAPARYLVTYYARRLDMSKPYDAIDNPVVLFRAQMPFRYADDSDFKTSSGNLNLQTNSTRYPTASDCSSLGAGVVNRAAQWLTQNQTNEPLLDPPPPFESLCNQDAVNADGTVPGSHSMITPRGMGLIVPHATDPAPFGPDFTPTTTFTCQDTDGDGKIDRVTLRLILGNYTSNGQTRNGQPLVQSQGLPQAVDLPNVK